jgi:hypothetical protein
MDPTSVWEYLTRNELDSRELTRPCIKVIKDPFTVENANELMDPTLM